VAGTAGGLHGQCEETRRVYLVTTDRRREWVIVVFVCIAGAVLEFGGGV
jgi:hypothetical protein